MVAVGFFIWILYNAPLFQKVMVVWWIPLTTIALGSHHRPLRHQLQDKWGARIVGVGVFVFLGDLTYTLYLVHWPVYLAIQPDATHWGYWPTELLRAGHPRHCHRELVPHREAPAAMAATIGSQGHRPHDGPTLSQPDGSRNAPSRPMRTAMSPTRPR